MATLIKNGTLITASDTFKADILFENEIKHRRVSNIRHRDLIRTSRKGLSIFSLPRSLSLIVCPALKFIDDVGKLGQ